MTASVVANGETYLRSCLDDVAGEAFQLTCMLHLLHDTLEKLLGPVSDLSTVSLTKMDREVVEFAFGEALGRSQQILGKADRAIRRALDQAA
jgi:hypothetical protein